MLKEKLLRSFEKIKYIFIKRHKLNKYALFFASLFILITIGLAAPSGFAQAGIGDLVMGILYGIIYIIFFILFMLAYLIAWLASHAVSISLNPAIMNQVFANPAIYDSWRLIRDICNLLFLLIMLLVAFGTIIQHSKYNIKNSFVKLIIAIFLINFSNVIAGVIIDFGNILMYGILKWMCPPTSTSCMEDSFTGLMQVVNDFKDTYNPFAISLEVWTVENAVGMAIATIYTFIYAFILLALAFFLIARTAGLAMLLILSPLAYFGGVMPGMEKIGQKWWNKIWSYSLFGPIFVLLLYISSRIAAYTITIPLSSNPDLAIWGTLIATIISNSIPLLFLLSIVPITRELGLMGTDVILKNTQGWRDGVANYAGNYADRWLARGAADTRRGWSVSGALGRYRRGMSNLSPTAWKRAVRNMRAEQDHDFDIAAGSHWNKLDRATSLNIIGKLPIDHKALAIDREVLRMMGQLSDNIAALQETNKTAMKEKDLVMIEASWRKLGKSGDVSVALRANNDKNGKPYEESRWGFNDAMNDLKKTIGKERAEILAEELGYLEDADGNTGFAGFRKVTQDGSRMRDIRDTEHYYDDDDEVKSKADYDRELAALHDQDDKDKFMKKWKTDNEWQTEAVNEKLAAKSPYSRNTKTKNITFRRKTNAVDENGNEIVGAPQVYTADDTLIEYINTIGEGNLKEIKKRNKKEAAKDINLLYEHAKRLHAAGGRLNDKELEYLWEHEKEFGEQEKRPVYLPHRQENQNQQTPNDNVEDEEEDIIPFRSPEEVDSKKLRGKGIIGVNRLGNIDIDDRARENFDEFAEINPELFKETWNDLLLHEEKHSEDIEKGTEYKDVVRNNKTVMTAGHAMEMQAQTNAIFNNPNVKSVDDAIRVVALQGIGARIAKYGVKSLQDKNLVFGNRRGQVALDESYLLQFKPEFQKKVYDEMNRVKQGVNSEYNKKYRLDDNNSGGNNPGDGGQRGGNNTPIGVGGAPVIQNRGNNNSNFGRSDQVWDAKNEKWISKEEDTREVNNKNNQPATAKENKQQPLAQAKNESNKEELEAALRIKQAWDDAKKGKDEYNAVEIKNSTKGSSITDSIPSKDELVKKGIKSDVAEKMVREAVESRQDFDDAMRGIEVYKQLQKAKGKKRGKPVNIGGSNSVVISGREFEPEDGEVIIENGKVVKGKVKK